MTHYSSSIAQDTATDMPFFREKLTSEERSRYTDWVATQQTRTGKNLKKQVLLKVDGETLTVDNALTLRPGIWLMDPVIHLAVKGSKKFNDIINDRSVLFFPSWFLTTLYQLGSKYQDGVYNFKAVSKWSKKFLKGRSIQEIKTFLFFKNVGYSHWTCYALIVDHKVIEVFDSLGESTPDPILQGLYDWFETEMKAVGITLNRQEWHLNTNSPDTPTQKNGFDCGMYMLLNSLCVAQRLPLSLVTAERVTAGRALLLLHYIDTAAATTTTATATTTLAAATTTTPLDLTTPPKATDSASAVDLITPPKDNVLSEGAAALIELHSPTSQKTPNLSASTSEDSEEPMTFIKITDIEDITMRLETFDALPEWNRIKVLRPSDGLLPNKDPYPPSWDVDLARATLAASEQITKNFEKASPAASNPEFSDDASQGSGGGGMFGSDKITRTGQKPTDMSDEEIWQREFLKYLPRGLPMLTYGFHVDKHSRDTTNPIHCYCPCDRTTQAGTVAGNWRVICNLNNTLLEAEKYCCNKNKKLINKSARGFIQHVFDKQEHCPLHRILYTYLKELYRNYYGPGQLHIAFFSNNTGDYKAGKKPAKKG